MQRKKWPLQFISMLMCLLSHESESRKDIPSTEEAAAYNKENLHLIEEISLAMPGLEQLNKRNTEEFNKLTVNLPYYVI